MQPIGRRRLAWPLVTAAATPFAVLLSAAAMGTQPPIPVQSNLAAAFQEQFGLAVPNPAAYVTSACTNFSDRVVSTAYVRISATHSRLRSLYAAPDGSGVFLTRNQLVRTPAGSIHVVVAIIDRPAAGPAFLAGWPVAQAAINGQHAAFATSQGLLAPIVTFVNDNVVLSAAEVANVHLRSSVAAALAARGVPVTALDIVVAINLDPAKTEGGSAAPGFIYLGNFGNWQADITDQATILGIANTIYGHEMDHIWGWSSQHDWAPCWSATSGEPTTTPPVLFGWTDVDGDGVPEILDQTPYGMAEPRSSLLFLDANSLADIFTYGPTTGVWSRNVTQPGGGFMSTSGGWAPGWAPRLMKLNDDGLSDLFLSNAITGQWFQMLNTGSSYSVQATGTWWPGWQKFVVDLDGDGHSDLFLYDPVSGQWFKCLSTPTGFSYLAGWWSPGWEVTPMDLNGDAFGDLFLFSRSTGQWYWALGQAGPGFAYPQTGFWAIDWQFYPGDYDGDGATDLFLYRPNVGQYYFAINYGTGFAYDAGGGWASGWTPVVVDFEGDGRSDLLLYNKATGRWFALLSDGDGHFTPTHLSIVADGFWSPGWDMYATDFNGDGRTDLLLYNPATGAWYQAWTSSPGAFTYVGGFWSPGLIVVAGAG